MVWHWIFFVVAILLAIVLALIGLVAIGGSKHDADANPIANASAWDLLTGRAIDKAIAQSRAESDLKSTGIFVLLLAAGAVAFAVYQGVQIFGDKPCVKDCEQPGTYQPQKDWYR